MSNVGKSVHFDLMFSTYAALPAIVKLEDCCLCEL